MRWGKDRWCAIAVRVTAIAIVGVELSLPAAAGELNPTAPPSSTMKSLDEVYDRADRPPSWSRSLSSTGGIPEGSNQFCNSPRFECLWPNGSGTYQAVLDRETGLVWHRFVSLVDSTWLQARFTCSDSRTANRMGWRLPTPAEMGSLVDLTTSIGLPNDHPFSGVAAGNGYWTNTFFDTVGANLFTSTSNVRAIYFAFDGAISGPATAWTSQNSRVWCVRGPNSGGL